MKKKEKNTNLIVKTFTVDGHRYYVRAKTEKEAFEKMALKKRDLEEGRYVLTGNTAVRDWVDMVLKSYKPNTSEEYLSEMTYRIGKHILPAIGNCPIRSVKPIQCQEILNAQKGMSKSHIAKLHQELCFIFEKAKSNHLIYENPAADLVRPEGYTKRRRSITDCERKHLVSVCAMDPCYNLFLLMLYAGCRPNEAVKVQGMDLIEKDGLYLLHIRGTKTENSDRYVPVVPELLPVLQSAGPFDLVAPNHAGRAHSESSYDRLVAHLKRDLNISMGCRVYRNKLVPPLPLAPDFVPYLLRHTFCTDLQKNGVDIRAAQKLMGHASIETTANIYTHQDDDTILQAARQMGAAPPVEVQQVQH